jgi:rhamnosyltransferase
LKNNGISAVLNVAALKAIQNGNDILLTMDQDSFFSKEMINKYSSFVDSLNWSKTSVVGVAPKDYDNHVLLEKNLEPAILTPVQLLITSGSFLNLKLFSLVGGFDERLFIDWVDYDYCLRSILSGYSVCLASNIYLFHVGGTPYKFLGRKIALYSPDRYYYIFRNHLYMWRKYIKYFPKLIFKNILVNIFLSILPNIILSKNKVKFIVSLNRAVRDIPKVFY